MIKTTVGKTFFALITLVAVSFATPAAAAPSKTAAQARAIPTGVFELMVGGSWEHEKKSGYYRAIALAAGPLGEEYAEVWFQWVAVDDKSAKVTKNISIKEIAKKKYPSLSLAMDIEENGQAILVVTHYDTESDKTHTHEFRAGKPGTYKAIETKVASE